MHGDAYQCYKSGAAGNTMKPQGIVVHSTGANNPNLNRYVGPDDGILGVNRYGNYWNRGCRPVRERLYRLRQG